MKNFRNISLVMGTLILTACNFTLAEDITPPPNYVSPTPEPTLGPLYPAQVPNVDNGATIYAEKCAPCHGETGMGDGKQGIQLNVSVPAFGLPDVARPASLAQWYTMVTRGNIERFMPPFASLTEQERWDVAAYAMTLHTTERGIEEGKELFEKHCGDCSMEFFKDQSKMSSLSEVELARIIKEGNDEVQAFGKNLNEDEVWAVAAYLRTLSFSTLSVASADTPLPPTEPASAPRTPAPVGTTPIAGTAQPAVENETAAISKPGFFGTIHGSVENKSGANLLPDQKVTLRGFDPGTNQNANPQQVLSQEATIGADGNFIFETVEMPKGRIFMAQMAYEGITLQSPFAIAQEGTVSLTLPPIQLYGTTEDPAALVIDAARLFFDYAENEVQIFSVYSFRNLTDKIVVVPLKNGVEIPFLESPKGAQALGYEPMQDSQPFTVNEDNLAFPPNEQPYGLIVFSKLAKEEQIQVTQPLVLPVSSLTVFLPAGVHAESTQLRDHGVQTIDNLNFQMYAVGDLKAGSPLVFSLLGEPNSPSTSTVSPNGKNNILIGAGFLGLALTLAGAWMFIRDRKRAQEHNDTETEKEEYDTPEEVMDEIIALDDLHKAKRISNKTYQKRREELKEILRNEMQD